MPGTCTSIMIIDSQVVLKLDAIDKQLSQALQVLLVQGIEDSQQLQSLQRSLYSIKKIVDDLVNRLSRQNSTKVYIDLQKVLDTLENACIDTLGDSKVLDLFKNALVQYTIVIAYYALLSDSLVSLPQAYDALDYYNSISASRAKSWYYGLQCMVPRFIKHSYENKTELLRPRMDLIMLKNFQFVGIAKHRNELLTKPWRYLNVLVHLPLSVIRDDLSKKLAVETELVNEHTIKLGELLDDFNSSIDTNEDMDNHISRLSSHLNVEGQPVDSLTRLKLIVLNIKELQEQKPNTLVMKPNFISRNWPVLLVGLLYGPSSIIAVWQSRYKILEFLQHNVLDFVTGLMYNWVYTPLKQVWATVRHDEGSAISVTSQSTLDSEMSSLSRMIVSFVVENSDHRELINENQLISQVEHGDLTQFLKIYETQLSHPIKNIVTGSLVRSLLIQVQKTKVDGSLALNGIDKMLKSQQLVFGILAMSPALAIIYTSFVALKRFVKLGSVWSNIQKYKYRISVSLNNIERIINDFKDTETGAISKGKDEYLKEGLLLIEISTLHELGKKIVPKKRISEWCRDVQELMTHSKSSRQTHLNVVNRIYHVYGRYL